MGQQVFDSNRFRCQADPHCRRLVVLPDLHVVVIGVVSENGI